MPGKLFDEADYPLDDLVWVVHVVENAIDNLVEWKKVGGNFFHRNRSGLDRLDSYRIVIAIAENRFKARFSGSQGSHIHTDDRLCGHADHDDDIAGKDSTKNLQARIGRSARLGPRSIGVLDAGATSSCLILQSIGKSLTRRLSPS